MVNPLRANRITFGAGAGSPYIENLDGGLSFYDPSVGSVDFQTLSNVNSPIVRRVSPVLQGADYTSIQDAIDSIDVGEKGVIYVYGGTYLESLTIRSNIDLVGLSAKIVSDGICIDIEDGNVTVQGFELIPGGVGQTRCISFVSTDSSHKLVYKNCTFYNAENAQSMAVYANKGSVYGYQNEYVGDNSDTQILNAERFNALELYMGALTLSNVANKSYVSANYIREVTLVDSALDMRSDYGSLSGDLNSTVQSNQLRGSATFANADRVTVDLDCPLEGFNYAVFSDNLSDHSTLVVQNRTATSFDLVATVPNAETVSWFLVIL